MRNLVTLLLAGLAVYTFPAQGCTGAKSKANDWSGFVAVNLTEAAMTTDIGPAPNPNKVPRAQCTQCNGTGRIVHGDGHSTECPNCYAFLGPIPADQLTYVDWRVPLSKTGNLECDCEKCGCSPCNCSEIPNSSLIKPAALKKQGGCSSGSCGTAGAGSCSPGSPADCGSGGCASGSCGSGGSGSDGPRFTGPVRRVGGFFRERRPVRRLFGRLFGRR